MNTSRQTNRLRLIDTLRGITVISMVIYHFCWDLASFRIGLTDDTLKSTPVYIWQQSICWVFILLAGYSFNLGRHHLKRGLMSLLSGIVITLVTVNFLYDQRIIFGVLWLIGVSILLMIPIDRIFSKSRKQAGIFIVVSFLLFLLTRDINHGYLGFEGIRILELPEFLYNGYFMTFLGFLMPGFFSTDYFSFLPWFFLFCTGYFSYFLIKGSKIEERFFKHGIGIFEVIGRNSLLIYILHQPLLYGVVWMISKVV
ncbi:MAG: DUF1624 domain-containing protein [Lachnospiraceae bacterium]|nr:DUF1624 domain-containing protein [Lachnospiraceae bacterium]